MILICQAAGVPGSGSRNTRHGRPWPARPYDMSASFKQFSRNAAKAGRSPPGPDLP